MSDIRSASKFIVEFISGYFSGKHTANDTEYFVRDPFIFDSTRTTDSFDKLGVSIADVSNIQRRVLSEGVFEFLLDVAVTKQFTPQQNCAIAVRVTGVVTGSDDVYKISSLHVSVSSDLLDYLDFLPLSEDFHNLSEIKAEFEKRAEKIEQESRHDPLTGILHRGAAKKLIDTSLKTALNGSALMLFDIDNFKQVNDKYGHIAGDDVLVHFSQLLENNFRSDDVIARLGGDEFIVFMKNASLEIVEKRAKHICELIRLLSHDYPVDLSVSIGIVIPEQNTDDTFEKLYFQADKALYNAKYDGKNRYRFYA